MLIIIPILYPIIIFARFDLFDQYFYRNINIFSINSIVPFELKYKLYILGKLNANQVATKFKNLLYAYRRIVQNEKNQATSGSARKTTTNKWKYYNIMEFTRDHCLTNEYNFINILYR